MIDTDKYGEIIKHGMNKGGWIVDGQLLVGGGKWRFTIDEYTDTVDMSKEEIEEWEGGLEPLWDALLQYIADAPLLLQEVKRLREAIAYILNGIGQVASDEFSHMVIEELRKVIE